MVGLATFVSIVRLVEYGFEGVGVRKEKEFPSVWPRTVIPGVSLGSSPEWDYVL